MINFLSLDTGNIPIESNLFRVFPLPMPFTEDLEILAADRMWYDFTEKIKFELTNNISEADLQYILSMLEKYINKIHPLSLTPVVISMFSSIDLQKFLFLTEKAISIIKSNSAMEKTYTQEIITLSLYKCIALTKSGNLEDVESQIIALKQTGLSKENLSLLYLTAALFYERMGNYDEAQDYLFQHAKETKKVYDIEKLVYLSIISTRFFDFASVSSFEEFSTLENLNLKKLFLSLQNGDEMSKISMESISEYINAKSPQHIKEKRYLLKIIKICFESEQKFVTFDHLISELAINEITVVSLLLKALGLKIIKGWIDSEQRILFFDSVLPRSLNSEELRKMKMKFVTWKEKVEDVIKTIESNK